MSEPVTSYRHICRTCKKEVLVPTSTQNAGQQYPRCCGKAMAYIGTVETAPTINTLSAPVQNLERPPMSDAAGRKTAGECTGAVQPSRR